MIMIKNANIRKNKQNDIYYGDENNSEIQTQPYILIRQRKSVIEARNLAASEGVPKEELEK